MQLIKEVNGKGDNLSSMRIEKVRIKGFRNYVNEEITFARQTLIIGANDIGKTNLLFALRILLDRGLSDQDLDLTENDYNIYSSTKEIQITLYFVEAVEDCIRSTFKGQIKDDRLILRYTKKMEGDFIIECGYSENTLSECPSRQYLKRLNLEYVNSSRDLAKYIRKSRQDLLRIAQEELSEELRDCDKTVKSELQKNLNEINGKIDQLNYVKESLQHVNRELRDMTSNDEDISVSFSAAETQVDRMLDNLELTYSRLQRKIHIGGDGRNNQVYFALWVAKQKAEHTKERVTFFAIEEPEAHLHPHQQRQLSKYLAANFSEQIFITTHSAQIATEFLPNRIVRLYKKKNAVCAAQGGCCSKIGAAFDDFGYRLNVVSAEVFFANGVFLVEGPSERIFYAFLDKTFGWELDKRNINIIDVGGVGFKQYIEVCKALDIPFVMRTDNDIFWVPRKKECHYAGISRAMKIYCNLLAQNDDEVIQYWKKNENLGRWPSDSTEHKKADEVSNYIRKALAPKGIYFSGVDLETDLAKSALRGSLEGWYNTTNEEELIKKMKAKKAENMLDFIEFCNKKEISFECLKDDPILDPINTIIEKARVQAYDAKNGTNRRTAENN